MNFREEIGGTIVYTVIVILTIIIFGALFVVIHEFTHSNMAHILGHMDNPLDIVWGNPFTLDGWDEGVSYSAMFNANAGIDAAIVAISPLILQSCFVICGMFILLSKTLVQRKWLFHLVFWLVIVNFMELVAYMPGGAFHQHGDIGNINHGLGLNPWILFLIGTPIVLTGLYILFRRILPRMNVVVAGDSHLNRYVILIFAAFYLFIFRSSSSSAFHFSPDMLWITSLFGYAAFFAVLYFCRPNKSWVIDSEKQFRKEINNVK